MTAAPRRSVQPQEIAGPPPPGWDGVPRHAVILVGGTVHAVLRNVVAGAAMPQGQVVQHAWPWPEAVVGQALAYPRTERDARLAATDHWDMPGWRARRTAVQLAACDAYRNALRDAPEQCADLTAIAWPAMPDTAAIAAG